MPQPRDGGPAGEDGQCQCRCEGEGLAPALRLRVDRHLTASSSVRVVRGGPGRTRCLFSARTRFDKRRSIRFRRDEDGRRRGGQAHRGAGAAAGRLGAQRARDRAAARVPADRPDLDGRAAAAPRPLESPRQLLRPRRARTAALGGEEADRMGRVHLAGRDAAAAPGAHALQPPRDPLQVAALAARVHARERVVQALHPARARAARATPLARARGQDRRDRREARLVGEPAGELDARVARGVRRDRDRRKAQRAAPLGPLQGLVAGHGDHSGTRGREAARGAAVPVARRAPLEGQVGGPSRRERRFGARPRHAPFALRPPDPRPRPRRGALRLPLPARDVRPGREARVRVLRAAASRRRPARGSR